MASFTSWSSPGEKEEGDDDDDDDDDDMAKPRSVCVFVAVCAPVVPGVPGVALRPQWSISKEVDRFVSKMDEV